MTYPQYDTLDYAQLAAEVLTYWNQNHTFEQSVALREGRPGGPALRFTFYEGPPSANGTPGIHHVMARTIKDIFCRYKTLRGFRVERKGGWDTHGLPIELQVEKEISAELGVSFTKEDIGKKITVEEYNRRCRETVMRFTDQWNDLTQKMGYWVDLDNPYVTYTNDYIESVWQLLKRLYDKGLLYKGYTIQPFSPKAGTGLSSHELNMPGTYKDVRDTTIVAQFKVKLTGKSGYLFDAADSDDVYILAWTTTPWTLPANSALTVGKDIDYVLIKTFNPYTFEPINVVLAKALVSRWFNEKARQDDPHSPAFATYQLDDNRDRTGAPAGQLIPWAVIDIPGFKGAHLEGIEYEQLMPYVQPEGRSDRYAGAGPKAFRVILGDFVTTEDGTGVVHTSPTFGADDFRVAQANDIPAIMVKDETGHDVPIVDRQGRFVPEITDFAGRYVKEEYYSDEERADPDFRPTDVLIAIKLKEENRAFRVEKYEHPYPHCWRTDKPILYYPLDSWFIRTTAVKDRLVELNKTINWQPESTGTGRFGNWLENLVDWNLSRSRYWGTPLPIWRSKYLIDGRPQEKCIGSFNELREEGWYYFGGDKYKEFEEKLLGATKRYLSGTHNSDDDNFLNSLALSRFDLATYRDWFTSLKEVTPQTVEELDSRNAEGLNFEFIKEFLEKPSVGIFDYHRPYVDQIAYIQPLGVMPIFGPKPKYRLYTREPDLIDVWFDSGAMPYAQWHYPFENEEKFKQAFPADFISEGVDQTRGWFFTLHAIAGMLFDSVAFKNVVSTGLVLDKNGNKMSKRLGNAVDPFATLAQYGPDATRWYMITNAEPWDNLKFNVDGIGEVQRKLFGTLSNTYNFFALYANLDQFSFAGRIVPVAERPELDRWILSKLQSLIVEVEAQFDAYNPTKAGRAVQDFVNDQLSNWYVRLARRRFWSTAPPQPDRPPLGGGRSGGPVGMGLPLDKQAAYETLHECLTIVAQLMSPIAPFYADWLYRNLTGRHPDGRRSDSSDTSVHLTDFPAADHALIDADLEQSMELAQRTSSLVHSLRKGHKLKVRQPLSRVLIPVLNADTRRQLSHVAPLIQSEVNVKAVEFVDDASGIVKKKVKPNFKALGPKYGKQMKDVAALITTLTDEQLMHLERTGTLALPPYTLNLSDVEVLTEDIPGWLVASDNGLTVALDVTVTDELRREGIARDFVNRIQNLRKDRDFNVTDKIAIELERNNDVLADAIEANKPYIQQEVQAVSLELVSDLNGSAAEIEMDEFRLRVRVDVV